MFDLPANYTDHIKLPSESCAEDHRYERPTRLREVYLGAFETSSFTPKERLRVARELGESSPMSLVHPTVSQDIAETYGAVYPAMRRASRNASNGPGLS